MSAQTCWNECSAASHFQELNGCQCFVGVGIESVDDVHLVVPSDVFSERAFCSSQTFLATGASSSMSSADLFFDSDVSAILNV